MDTEVIPRVAERYDVGALLGVGATARVHRAWDRTSGAPVAVKIFPPGTSPVPGPRELAGVRAPGVVAVHDTGVDRSGRPFLVMDLVEGVSLADQLRGGALPATAVARTGAALAAALAAVHARGVVHRDLKPANVLLDTAGQPWLTDFGIAAAVGATPLTPAGEVLGTAAYMAPEQVRGEPSGTPADVYALGLVLVEALTGRREYPGTPLEAALARLQRAPRVPADVPEALAAALRAMTATDPGVRPAAAQAAAALRGAARVRRSRRTGRLVGALATLAVAAAGVGTVAVTRPVAPAGPPPLVAADSALPHVRFALPDLDRAAADAASAALAVPLPPVAVPRPVRPPVAVVRAVHRAPAPAPSADKGSSADKSKGNNDKGSNDKGGHGGKGHGKG